jgi:hypothetical protein
VKQLQIQSCVRDRTTASRGTKRRACIRDEIRASDYESDDSAPV